MKPGYTHRIGFSHNAPSHSVCSVSISTLDSDSCAACRVKDGSGMKPTLADMLSVLVDAWIVDSANTYPSDEIQGIAREIEAEYGAIPFYESLNGLDPFRHYSSHDQPLFLMAGDDRAWCTAVDGALFRLANSGFAHTI